MLWSFINVFFLDETNQFDTFLPIQINLNTNKIIISPEEYSNWDFNLSAKHWHTKTMDETGNVTTFDFYVCDRFEMLFKVWSVRQ